jgi:hypothetical protein
VIHEEALAHHDADEEPTIAEDSVIVQGAGQKEASMAKRVLFND